MKRNTKLTIAIAGMMTLVTQGADLAIGGTLTLPTGLRLGDQYRLIFVTQDGRDATSPVIEDYNEFVTAQAALIADLPPDLTWRAIASTAAYDDADGHHDEVHARNNAPADSDGSIPIYNTCGERIANGLADLWDGTVQNDVLYDQFGAEHDGDPVVWTGSDKYGWAKHLFGTSAGPLGSIPFEEPGDPLVAFGSSIRNNYRWLGSGALADPEESHSLYALSGPITVVPESGALMLLTMGAAGLACWGLRRARAVHGTRQQAARTLQSVLSRTTCVLTLAVAVVAAVLTLPGGRALADWDPGDPDTKWSQLPDVTPFISVDVDATDVEPEGVQPPNDFPRTLADDFLCESNDLITGIHIWGSWKDEEWPAGDLTNVTFRLSIHSDIPAGQVDPDNPQDEPVEWSRPGTMLWEQTFTPGTFTVRSYAWPLPLIGGWYDPAANHYVPFGDLFCWQYNFQIPYESAFEQQGSPTDPVTYWLDVDALVPRNLDGVQWEFGWKTSSQHWNDSATWRVDQMPPSQWNALRSPRRHLFSGQNIDLAFALTTGWVPEPSTFVLLATTGMALLFRGRRWKKEEA
jgi:hypothetical protein